MLTVDLRIELPDFTAEAAFEAPAGVTALFGRSGAGKTTLINAVAGLVRPASGRIEVGGTVLFDAAKGIDLPVQARKVGYVFQDGRLFPHMTVARNLSYGGSVDAQRVIAMLGLGPLLARSPATLSGGERQRLKLATNMAEEGGVYVLDEPTTGLHLADLAQLLALLDRLVAACALRSRYWVPSPSLAWLRRGWRSRVVVLRLSLQGSRTFCRIRWQSWRLCMRILLRLHYLSWMLIMNWSS